MITHIKNVHRKQAVVLLALLSLMPCSFVLAQIKQKTIDSFVFDLKNPDPAKRKKAAQFLGDYKVAPATPDLVAAAGDSNPDVRREIIVALTKISDARALPAYVKFGGDKDKAIREKCLQGIVFLYVPKEGGFTAALSRVANYLNPWADEWAEVVISPGIQVDVSAIDALRGRLQDSDEEIRAKAAQALGILRARSAISAMRECLQLEKFDNVRFELIRSFRKIGDPFVAQDLAIYMNYGDVKVRNEAVFTMGRLRYRTAVSDIATLYEKESSLPAKQIDKTYRMLLLDALAFIGDPASKDIFIKEKQSFDDVLRLHAFEGLARIGDPVMATDISSSRLHEKIVKIQTAQAYALYRMGRKEYLYEVVKALGSRKTDAEAKQYLMELKPEELPDLFAEISVEDVSAREALAETFGLIGDRRAIPSLQELGKDRRGNILAEANKAMRLLGASSDAK